MDSNVINKRISELLDKEKFKKNGKKNQKALAEAIGVPFGTLSQWLKKDRDIPAKHMKPIADFFEVSTDYLLGMTDEPRVNLASSTFGERLKWMRTTARLSQKELGEKAGGLTEAMISMAENDRKMLSHVSLGKIADVLGCTCDYLVRGTDLEVQSGISQDTNKPSLRLVANKKGGYVVSNRRINKGQAKYALDICLSTKGVLPRFGSMSRTIDNMGDFEDKWLKYAEEAKISNERMKGFVYIVLSQEDAPEEDYPYLDEFLGMVATAGPIDDEVIDSDTYSWRKTVEDFIYALRLEDELLQREQTKGFIVANGTEG